MSTPRTTPARAFKTVRFTAGNKVMTSASWATLDAALDITLAAQVGDVIEAHLSGVWGAEAQDARLDVATWNVAGAVPINYFGGAVEASTGDGVGAWFGPSGQTANFGGAAWRTLVVGDIDAKGEVVLRVRYRGTTAANKTIYANANLPLFVHAKNLGPPDPY